MKKPLVLSLAFLFFFLANVNAVTVTFPSYTNVTCNSLCNGSVSALGSAGVSPYSYAWTGPNSFSSSAQNITNLCPGTYTCTVTDNIGAQASNAITISQPSMLTLTPSVTPSTCGNPNGSITINVSGGTPAYTFSWNPSVSFSNTANNLLAGIYQIAVTDANGCAATVTVTISNQAGPNVNIISSTNCSCFGSCDGTASANATGNGPMTYSWSSAATTASISNLCTGAYMVTATDVNGCVANASVAITQPPLMSAFMSSVPSGCNMNDGSASSWVSGGVGAYTYSWSTVPVQTSTAAIGLSASNYTLTVWDANGCTVSASVAVGDSCDYVWPGDANDDAVADNTDILDIGIANGATGTSRANASLTWIGQPSAAWGQTLASGTDYKWVDCNGDGTIDPNDTTAVIQNFGYTHNNRIGINPPHDASLPDLSVAMNQSQLSAGSQGTLSISLGSVSIPATNIYGIAFTLNFDAAQIDAATFRMNENGTWMGTPGTDLMGVVITPATGGGSVQVAITRLNQLDVNGSGLIANMAFTATNALTGTGNMQNVIFSITNVTVISADETPQLVNTVSDSVMVADPVITAASLQTNNTGIFVYPNPFSESATITLPGMSEGQSWTLTLSDAAGRVVMTRTGIGSSTVILQKGDLEAGVYFCTLQSDGEISATTKLLVQ
jgi:hypothetical protein